MLALLAAFSVGVLVDWSLRTYGPPQPHAPTGGGISGETRHDAEVRLTPSLDRPGRPVRVEGPDLRKDRAVVSSSAGRLRVPIDNVKIESFKDGFAERRADRPHDAVDILAPQNTPVHAVESGTIAKLFVSRRGGNTIYQFDPSGRLCYYYAHLARYADGLHEGDPVSQGQIIGYVGTSGNAPPNTPHLHFAVFELTDDHLWWKGRALDPYEMFKPSE